MSFVNLRKNREARLKSSQRLQGSPTLVPLGDAQISSPAATSSSADATPESTPYSLSEVGDLHSSIPSTLEIRVSPISGRGLYLKNEAKSIEAGSTLFEITPHVSALSTRCLSSHCSHCQAERTTEDSLKRCTLCKAVWYDSQACQNADWVLHKAECVALRRWDAAAREAGVTDGKEGSVIVPSDAIRALGRILWNFERLGTKAKWTREIENMQSHRKSLSDKSTAHSVLTSLGHSLARYMGLTSDETGFAKWGIESSAQLVDLLSKFTTNSFSLTSPSLSPIGVAVSPSAALINHSCAPNAVVVFPRMKTTTPMPLAVVALRDIQPGEQILNSYVDITLPTSERKREVSETYMFECRCPACTSTAPDPRVSFTCPKCRGLTPVPDTEDEKVLEASVNCLYCPEVLAQKASKCVDAVKVAREALEKAAKLQFTEPPKSRGYTSSALSLLDGFPLHLGSDPLLALLRLHLSILIDDLASAFLSPPSSIDEQRFADTKVDEVCRVAARVVSGLSNVLPMGHPVRGIALAELGKLLCVDVDPTLETSDKGPSSSSQEPNRALPRGPDRLQLAAQVLYRAREELVIGFGREHGGGQVGNAVDGMLKDLEREASVWRKATMSGANTAALTALLDK